MEWSRSRLAGRRLSRSKKIIGRERAAMVATKPRSVIHNDFSSLTALLSGAAGFSRRLERRARQPSNPHLNPANSALRISIATCPHQRIDAHTDYSRKADPYTNHTSFLFWTRNELSKEQ